MAGGSADAPLPLLQRKSADTLRHDRAQLHRDARYVAFSRCDLRSVGHPVAIDHDPRLLKMA
jgi:hypothetical protein